MDRRAGPPQPERPRGLRGGRLRRRGQPDLAGGGPAQEEAPPQRQLEGDWVVRAGADGLAVQPLLAQELERPQAARALRVPGGEGGVAAVVPGGAPRRPGAARALAPGRVQEPVPGVEGVVVVVAAQPGRGARRARGPRLEERALLRERQRVGFGGRLGGARAPELQQQPRPPGASERRDALGVERELGERLGRGLRLAAGLPELLRRPRVLQLVPAPLQGVPLQRL